MIRITNREAFHAKVTNWLGSVRDMAEQAAVSMAYETLHLMLITAPQYSGQFVASWNASIGQPDYTTYQPTSTLNPGSSTGPGARSSVEPYSEGDATAINMAMSRFNLSGFKLGQSIFLSNSVKHTEPYSVLIEENKIKFRPENPSGGRVMARALQQASVRYANLTRTRIASLIGA